MKQLADHSKLQMLPHEFQIVSEILKRIIPDLEVLAFGSRVKGTAKKYSDLDLAIVADTPLTLQAHAAMTDAFSESDLPWKVDFVEFATIDEAFKNVIRSQFMILQNASE